MATRIQLWQSESAAVANQPNESVAGELMESMTLSDNGARKARRAKRQPRLTPIEPSADAVAALLVPDDCRVGVCRNGIVLSPGLHLIAHADRIDVADKSYFVSVEMAPDFDRYDVDRHGADAYCFMTGTRINVGEAIVVCPSVPGVCCGKITRRQAWDRALDRAAETGRPLKCAGCGFDTAAQPWRPLLEQPSDTLEKLMGVIAGGGLSA